MAVNPWFQEWNPPHDLFASQNTFYTPINHENVSHFPPEKHEPAKDGKYNPVSHLLPFFLQLGLLDFPSPNEYEPPERTGPFTTMYKWKVLDYEYPSEEDRENALENGDFIPKNNLPLGLDIYGERLFITIPKWKPGIPATLAVLPKTPKETSPRLVPYPSWDFHDPDSCEGLTSVFRVQADICGRLWVLDSGQTNVTIKPNQICPPQIVVFDIATDRLLVQYVLPEEYVKQDGLFSNIAVDVRDGDCLDAHAYLTDVWRYGLVVFSLKRLRSWRITDHLFYPEPLSAAYNLHGLEFEWVDGLFGLALSPYNPKAQDRLLYFNPMSSFRQFYVKTSVVCNETGWSDVKDAFKVLGQSRGKFGHASATAMDRNGVMFMNMVTRDSVACWDSRKPYRRNNLGVVAKSTKALVFPNDLKIDNEKRQSVWVLSNRLPFYLYRELSKDDYNFRIMSTYVDEAIKDTICDPNVRHFDTFKNFPDGDDCY